MRDLLEQDLSTPVRWVEPGAMNTWESAHISERLLRLDGIRALLVVTHAWHVRGAMLAFRAAGLEGHPCTSRVFATRGTEQSLGLLPAPRALLMTHLAWREALGLTWYGLRFGLSPATRPAAP